MNSESILEISTMYLMRDAGGERGKLDSKAI